MRSRRDSHPSTKALRPSPGRRQKRGCAREATPRRRLRRARCRARTPGAGERATGAPGRSGRFAASGGRSRCRALGPRWGLRIRAPPHRSGERAVGVDRMSVRSGTTPTRLQTQSMASSNSSVFTARRHSSTRSLVKPSCSRTPKRVATLATTLSSDSYCGSGVSSSVLARASARMRRC